mmetsp:Transcript_119435/g.337959  ORF Transcript_119435/g.337959 Transcript_119435/m.337959 type:complete len:353 (-) Transcript_119435:71-1129(-)
MECACGFSCGTPSAMEKHMARFPGSPGHRCLTPGEALAADADRRGAERRAFRRHTTAEVRGHVDDVERSKSEFAHGSRSMVFAAASCSTWRPKWADASADPAANVVRLVVVRHARSENKDRGDSEASPDPGLTEHGHAQAEALGSRLADELGGASGVVVVSSPAKRCLLTIKPALGLLRLPRGSCICHGAGYEFRGAGLDFPGTSFRDISREFPDFAPAGFGHAGGWDYRGDSPKETEDEARERALHFLDWLTQDAVASARSKLCKAPEGARKELATLVLVTHQTFMDLLVQVLVRGTAALWEYGVPQYRLQNAGITEIYLKADGSARVGYVENDGQHLEGLKSLKISALRR